MPITIKGHTALVMSAGIFIAALPSTGCRSVQDESGAHPHEQTKQLEPTEAEQAAMESAIQRLNSAEQRIAEVFLQRKVFLENNPIIGFSEGPTDDASRLRMLIIQAKALQEALTATQARKSEISDRQTAGEILNELDLAKLRQNEHAEQSLLEELEKTNVQIKKLAERRQRYVKLRQTLETLVKNCAAAEQERDAAWAEIQVLKEAEK